MCLAPTRLRPGGSIGSQPKDMEKKEARWFPCSPGKAESLVVWCGSHGCECTATPKHECAIQHGAHGMTTLGSDGRMSSSKRTTLSTGFCLPGPLLIDYMRPCQDASTSKLQVPVVRVGALGRFTAACQRLTCTCTEDPALVKLLGEICCSKASAEGIPPN